MDCAGLNHLLGERLALVCMGISIIGFAVWIGSLDLEGCLNPNGCYPGQVYIQNGTVDLIPSVCFVLLLVSFFEWKYYRSMRSHQMSR